MTAAGDIKIYIYRVAVKTEAILQLIPAQLSAMLQRVPGLTFFQSMIVKFKRKVLEALFTSSI